MENNEQPHGGRNLAILGLTAALIALTTSGISLYLYHASGDIYLDRSRPGYLPEKDEQSTGETEYIFSDTGDLTEDVLEEFITHLDETIDHAKSITSPFAEKSISDDTLGIPRKDSKK